MVTAKLLYKLQETDLDVDISLSSIKDVDSHLMDDASVVAARTTEQGRNQELQKLESRLREEELEIEGLKTKMVTLEKRLYSGTVQQPRELEGLEEELKSLRLHNSKLEEKTLSSMMELEEARAELQEAQVNLAAAEDQWQEKRTDLSTKRKSLLENLSLLRNKRNELASGIAESYLSLYDRIRSSHKGQAVARVERNTCHGCRITLPTREIQRARTANDLVFCVSCGRILHIT